MTNAYSEALFRICKHRPDYPPDGFESPQAARLWIHRFIGWYNHEHRHSEIRYVAPAQRHAGLDNHILKQRHQLYQQARERHPTRWSGKLRNRQPIGSVWFNPQPDHQPLCTTPAVEAA